MRSILICLSRTTNGVVRPRSDIARTYRWCAATLAAMISVGAPGFSAAQQGASVVVGAGIETTGVNRGKRGSMLDPAVSVFAEVERGIFLAGAFATPVTIQEDSTVLIIGYATVQTEALGLNFNAGGRYFSFVASTPFQLDLDADGILDVDGKKGFSEYYGGAQKRFRNGQVSLKGFYTPVGFASAGSGVYLQAAFKRTLFDGLELRGSFGVSENRYDAFAPDYRDISLGLYRNVKGFDVFLTLSDTLGLPGESNTALVLGIEKPFSFFFGGEPASAAVTPPLHAIGAPSLLDGIARRRTLIPILYD